VLMGIDATDPAVIEQVRKRSTTKDDMEACRLLREHNIHSVIGYIVGLGDETCAGPVAPCGDMTGTTSTRCT
jgi:anaerobic magnesium-protoporphyrin IX monomethyl ester cyclase